MSSGPLLPTLGPLPALVVAPSSTPNLTSGCSSDCPGLCAAVTTGTPPTIGGPGSPVAPVYYPLSTGVTTPVTVIEVGNVPATTFLAMVGVNVPLNESAVDGIVATMMVC